MQYFMELWVYLGRTHMDSLIEATARYNLAQTDI